MIDDDDNNIVSPARISPSTFCELFRGRRYYSYKYSCRDYFSKIPESNNISRAQVDTLPISERHRHEILSTIAFAAPLLPVMTMPPPPGTATLLSWYNSLPKSQPLLGARCSCTAYAIARYE